MNSTTAFPTELEPGSLQSTFSSPTVRPLIITPPPPSSFFYGDLNIIRIESDVGDQAHS